ncbi:ATP-binding cassette domain-containing protein [Bacillus massiliigorillae]|uniref:ATP-binding cassette domain-containing protein n=1 Tax=Bacillus massiliigorillae TaxID=1243664 RepID=UPI00039C4ECD|nr:ATP-binding cassette domain-containing protein [Bacillus massiliigorillae]
MSEIILQTDKLSKRYGNTNTLKECSLRIERGQIYGLVGKNGAGKTTFMRLICGQSIPSSGSINLFGETGQKGIQKSRVRIGCMLETPAFFPDCSAKKNLKIYCMKKGLPDHGHVDELLDFVGLGDVKDKNFKQFSLGMKQRLGLALALLGYPEFLILDEPINGLDPIGIIQIRDLLVKLNQEKGVTILISSHLLKELSTIATHYGFINRGILIGEISAKKLQQECQNVMRLKVNEPSRACAVLENICGLKNYKILPGNIIECYELLEDPEQINRELITNGIEVFSISIQGKDLEEYFLDMLRGVENA